MTEQTRQWLEAYDPSPLMDGQAFWGASQDNWTWHSGRMRAEIDAASTNGTWQGVGQAEALALAQRDEAQSKEQAAVVVAAQATARTGAADLGGMRSVAQSAIMAAEDPDPVQGNFTVTNQLGVEDNMTSYPGGSAQRSARQAMAEYHSERINSAVTALREQHATVMAAMRGHASTLRDMHVQMAGHGFKTGPGDLPIPPGIGGTPPGPQGPIRDPILAHHWPTDPPPAPPKPPTPPDPSKHVCGPIEVGTDVLEVATGNLGIWGGIAGEVPSFGGSSGAVLGGSYLLGKGLEDLEKCQVPNE